MKRLFAYAAAVCIAGGMALSSFGADAYIESSGAQAIDTGYYPNPNTKVVIDFQFTQLKQQKRIFGTEVQKVNGTFDANYLTLSAYNSGSVDGAGNLSWGFQDGEGNWSSSGTTVQMSRTLFVLDGYNDYYVTVTNNWTGDKYWTRDYASINAVLAKLDASRWTRTRTKTAIYPLARDRQDIRIIAGSGSTRSKSGSRGGSSTTTSRGRAAMTSASRTS